MFLDWHEVGMLKVPPYVSKPFRFVAFTRGQSASRRGVKQKSPGGCCLEMISYIEECSGFSSPVSDMIPLHRNYFNYLWR